MIWLTKDLKRENMLLQAGSEQTCGYEPYILSPGLSPVCPSTTDLADSESGHKSHLC